jgi:hypothetical protein
MATTPAQSNKGTNSTSFKSQKSRNMSSSASTAAATLAGGGEGRDFVQLNATGLKWTDDGKRLLVLGKDRFCSCDIAFKEDDGSLDVKIDEEGDLNRSVEN